MYILKLDIYEKEKWKHIAAIFAMSFVTAYGCDFLYPLFRSFGFDLNGNVVNDFIYCIFGIGFIEETVKFIPFLIMLKFTKAINEPYDYLLYASVAALGFAFAENILYLKNYGIHIATGRAIYAAVAHMTFCSTVTYGLLLKKYRFTKYPTFLVFLLFFFIAMFVHGFYDFWLINEYVSDYKGITTVFFLITIHLWFSMKNNAISISPFHNEQEKINNDHLKHYLVISLTSIFMFSYVYVFLLFGKYEAYNFFWRNAISYGYVIFYLIMSFSSYNIIKGVFKPLGIPFHFIVPGLKRKKK
jgi:RsiW-degrading membrane proteinase PrsW (M82 family)